MRFPSLVLKTYKVKTSREFRSIKRRELREVIKAIDELRVGCYYLPDGGDAVDKMDKIAKDLKVQLQVKNWR